MLGKIVYKKKLLFTISFYYSIIQTNYNIELSIVQIEFLFNSYK